MLKINLNLNLETAVFKHACTLNDQQETYDHNKHKISLFGCWGVWIFSKSTEIAENMNATPAESKHTDGKQIPLVHDLSTTLAADC